MKGTLKKHRIFNTTYLLIGIINIIAVVTENTVLRLIAMPMIGMSLIFYLLLKTKLAGQFAIRIFLGLMLAMAGDIMLLFSSEAGLFFLASLVSTLLGYICYLVAFACDIRFRSLQDKKPGLLLFLLVGIVSSAYYLLHVDKLDDFATEALFHIFVLSLLPIFAAFRIKRVNASSFRLILISAICFVLSDYAIGYSTLIRYDKMLMLVYLVNYLLAQYLLVMGTVERKVQPYY